MSTSTSDKILKEIQTNSTKTLYAVQSTNPAFHWCNLRYKTGDTPLHCASRLGYNNLVLDLVQNFQPNAVNCRNNDGKTALHDAAQFSQSACCRILLENGAEVNALKRGDWTPLMLACTKPSVETVRVLLEYNAMVNLRNKDGWSVVHLVARCGSNELLQSLLETDLRLDATSKNGRSALHIAALHSHKPLVETLLKLGLNPNASDNCGNTPLHEAILGRNLDVARVLIRNGAEVHKRNNCGFTLVHLAAGCEESGENVIKFVVEELGLAVDDKSTKGGFTPLHCAARKNQRVGYECLVQLGANEGLVDEFGRKAKDYFSF